MSSQTSASHATGNGLFGLFCLGSYLLSLSYGTTFLLAMKLRESGGSESDAGTIISVAMLSTFLAVIFSGHLTDLIGAPRAIAAGAVLLAAACLGFATVPAFGVALLASGLILGFGWGVFYTLGPIIVAMIIEPARRVKYFALLSGSMMSGIGTGPLVGRASEALGYSVESAFVVAAIASLAGGLVFFLLGPNIKQQQARLGPVTVCKISARAAQAVLSSKAVFAIIMVGLGGAIFGGLSSFQTSYAALNHLDYSLFFLGFMSAAISCRLLVAGYIVKRDPYLMSSLLSALMVVSVLMFTFFVHSSAAYLLAAVVLGVGYGLTYSVINGLAANEAPAGQTAQSLVLFSLSYFVGVFGFPLLAGKVIVNHGMSTLLYIILVVALCNWSITLARLVWRRTMVGATA
ncbi:MULTISPECIES: MFS transporter [Pseudomonas]|uniref:MFS transporter n=1 Tax=Pseudomonas haemolytica TaxID=2600065 RepID=A0A5P1D682_9PSED|nr:MULTISPECIES: MFS transporter [Pseudomonas]MBJ2244531.1 MFS transporter [Pseudomonas haemolytica]MBJ2271615.1 MFS transporter [Pseudomonas haemolytica]MBJ2284400.1 MFS transporter [Pseudomonas sp. MF6755]MBK3447774.1 MFS transporter [Pseudomonas haemolytica]MBK3459516.1 MFS transporter [Pseudomonas haemolytica]